MSAALPTKDLCIGWKHRKQAGVPSLSLRSLERQGGDFLLFPSLCHSEAHFLREESVFLRDRVTMTEPERTARKRAPVARSSPALD